MTQRLEELRQRILEVDEEMTRDVIWRIMASAREARREARREAQEGSA